MSKYCANCGAETPEAVGICDNCGMPVSEAAPSREALPQKAPAQPPRTPPLAAEESTPDRRSQLEQSERWGHDSTVKVWKKEGTEGLETPGLKEERPADHPSKPDLLAEKLRPKSDRPQDLPDDRPQDLPD